jgi:hypothetical protein
MLLETTTQEYILVPVTGPDGVDLSLLPVFLALVPDGAQDPGSGDWKAAAWVGGEIGLIYHPGDYPPGEYMAWWKITAGAEIPVAKSGRVRIGDSRT